MQEGSQNEAAAVTTGGQIVGGVTIAVTVVVLVGLLFAVRSCASSFSDFQQAQKQLDAQSDRIANTISPADRDSLQSMINKLIADRVILKLETGRGRADLHVLPAFHALSTDDKSLVMTAAYKLAFGLPPATSQFSWPMAVVDGTSGERLRTVDFDKLGCRW